MAYVARMTAPQLFALAMVFAALAALWLGFPVALTLAGVATLAALAAAALGVSDLAYLTALPYRVTGFLESDLFQALPLFILFGLLLQRSRLAGDLLDDLSMLFGPARGGHAAATTVVGALLCPMLGVVGASVVALTAAALPGLLRDGFDRTTTAGVVTAAGTLGALVPPSIALVMLTDFMRNAVADANALGAVAPVGPFTVVELYRAAVVPALAIVAGYVTFGTTRRGAIDVEPVRSRRNAAARAIGPLVFLSGVMAIIVTGRVYVVEAAAAAALAVLSFACVTRRLTLHRVGAVLADAMMYTGVLTMLLLAASTFNLVFRGLDGHRLVNAALLAMPGGWPVAMVAVVVGMLALACFLDALELLALVVPIAAPPLLAAGAPPVPLAVVLALAMATGFLLPPAGFALSFAQSAAEGAIRRRDAMRGVLPYVAINACVLLGYAAWSMGWPSS